MGALSLAPKTQLGDVFAAKRLSHVAELGRLGPGLFRLVGVCGWMDGEDLIVAEGIYGSLREEACVVHGTMVDYLNEGVILVSNGCVVDVD